MGEPLLLRRIDITGQELKACRKAMAISANGMARLLGYYDGAQIRRWERAPEVPRNIEIMVRCMLKHPKFAEAVQDFERGV